VRHCQHFAEAWQSINRNVTISSDKMLLAFCLTGIALVLVSACRTAPRTLAPGAQASADALLAPYQSANELGRFVGHLDAGCVQNSQTTELCQWQAGKRDSGWRAMAEAIETRSRVNLICELPTSGAPRSAGSCTIHPVRSNRKAWETGGRGGAKKPGNKFREKAEAKAKNRRTADRWIAEARTMLELSRLLGAIPDECTSRSENEQDCLWRTTKYTFGHGTLAAWIEVPKSKKIWMRCPFPKDGGRRPSGSCHAQVGS